MTVKIYWQYRGKNTDKEFVELCFWLATGLDPEILKYDSVFDTVIELLALGYTLEAMSDNFSVEEVMNLHGYVETYVEEVARHYSEFYGPAIKTLLDRGFTCTVKRTKK